MVSLSFCQLTWQLIAFFSNRERALVSYQAAIFVDVLYLFYCLLVIIKAEVSKA